VADPSVIVFVITPAIFLVAFWFSQITPATLRPDFAALVSYLVYAAVIFILVSAVILPSPETNATPLALLFRAVLPGAQSDASFDLVARWGARPDMLIFRPPDTPRNSGDGPLAAGLVERYAAGKDRVAVLIAPDSSNEALLTTHKADVFPLGDVKDQSFSPSAEQRALAFQHHLAAGDFIFVDLRFANLLPVQMQIVERLCREFSLHPVEVTGSGIAAIRLDSTQVSAGACTCGQERLSCPASN
jgi:hypothetical protein